MAASDDIEDRLRELRASLEALPTVSEPPKTTLRILGSAKSEQYWNTLLAYFLDPSQPHGFGADLLKSFLDKFQRETDIGLLFSVKFHCTSQLTSREFPESISMPVTASTYARRPVESEQERRGR